MEVNIEAIAELIKERFRNNKTWFAEEMGINYSYLHLILNGKRKPTSDKFCNAIIQYCKNNNLDYRKYIFLP